MSQNLPRFDFWEHLPTVVDWPTGNGGRTTIQAAAQTGPGKKVVVHAIIPLGVTAPTGAITLLHGDGSTAYTAVGWGLLVRPAILDVEFTDGLSIGAGTTGNWMIMYSLRN